MNWPATATLFCISRHKWPCHTTQICEQPSPISTFASSQSAPSCSQQQPWPQCTLLPSYIWWGGGVQAAAGPKIQQTAVGEESTTIALNLLALSPPLGVATGQILASLTSGVPEGLCGCLGSSHITGSHSLGSPGRAGPDGHLRGSSVCKEPEGWIVAIWLVASWSRKPVPVWRLTDCLCITLGMC